MREVIKNISERFRYECRANDNKLIVWDPSRPTICTRTDYYVVYRELESFEIVIRDAEGNVIFDPRSFDESYKGDDVLKYLLY